MEIRKGYKKQKQEEVLDEFGIKLRMKGQYEIKSIPGNYWLWFPHCETGFKGDYNNTFSPDGSRLEVTPATDKGKENMHIMAEELRGKTLICLPKLDNGYYTFVGVFKYRADLSKPNLEVYEKISDFFSDETGVEEKKNNKLLFIILGVLAAIIAALCLKMCNDEKPAPEPVVEKDTVTVVQKDTVVVQKEVETVIEKIQKDFNAAKFEKGKEGLSEESKAVLRVLASQLAKFPEANLKIVGHASKEGSESYNQKLSEKRAKACVDFLISEGISADRLSSEGKGSSEPIDEENPEKNRRTEFIVMD